MTEEKRHDPLFDGNDNYGRPRSDYLHKLTEMTDKDLVVEGEKMIWLAAYAANNPKSDYHWMASAIYVEADRRGKTELYKQAYDQAVRSCT